MHKFGLKARFWWFFYLRFNRLAWKFATPPGRDAALIDHKKIWWRLNGWAARNYTHVYGSWDD